MFKLRQKMDDAARNLLEIEIDISDIMENLSMLKSAAEDTRKDLNEMACALDTLEEEAEDDG